MANPLVPIAIDDVPGVATTPSSVTGVSNVVQL